MFGKVNPKTGLKSGTVIHYTGDMANLPNDRVIIREIVSTYGNYYEVITLGEEPKKGRINSFVLKTKEEAKFGDRFIITDKILTDDEIMDLVNAEKIAEGKRILNADKKKDDREKEKEELKKKYPYFLLTDEKNTRDCKIAIKNIRIELKKEFSGVKFSVRMARWGTIHIGVPENMGVDPKKLDVLVGKYQYGHFNGMEDIYEYQQNVFNEIFGGAEYIFCFKGDSGSSFC